MEFYPAELHGAWLIKLEPAFDSRGFFARTFCVEEFTAHGLETNYAQPQYLLLNARKGTLARNALST